MSGAADRQLWDEALQRLYNLSTLTCNHNAELLNRVAELERECQLWQTAHAASIDEADRMAKAHQLQLKILHKQVSGIDLFREQDPLVLCVINGEKMLFSDYLFSQGHNGGREAAQQLTQAIADQLTAEDVHVYSRLSYWVYLYINKAGVGESLVRRGVCSLDQFEAFLSGFSQSAPRFNIIDVSSAWDAPSAKARELVESFAKFPQTIKIFFAGGDDPCYGGLFSSLEEQDILGKVALIRDAATPTEPAFPLRQVSVKGLFGIIRSPSSPPRPCGQAGHHPPTVTTNGGLISPKSPSQHSPLKSIDPLLPLHKQAPPPCNEHYLMTCSKGPGACKYSHDYILTPEQLASLAQNAKKAPCNWLKNGLACPFGERCCWGHICPNGAGCYHKSKGKCWFKGMHA